MNLSPSQSVRLVEVLRRAKISTAGLKPQSPWGFDSPRAEAIRMAVEALDPALAQELSAEVEPSLEYVALMARAEREDVDISGLPDALRQEVMLRNGEAIRAQQQAQEEAMLASWDERARQMAGARGVDLDAPRQPRNRMEAQAMEVERLIALEKQAMAEAGR